MTHQICRPRLDEMWGVSLYRIQKIKGVLSTEEDDDKLDRAEIEGTEIGMMYLIFLYSNGTAVEDPSWVVVILPESISRLLSFAI